MIHIFSAYKLRPQDGSRTKLGSFKRDQCLEFFFWCLLSWRDVDLTCGTLDAPSFSWLWCRTQLFASFNFFKPVSIRRILGTQSYIDILGLYWTTV